MALVGWTKTHRSDERAAGLKMRCSMVLRAYGGAQYFAKRFGVPFSSVRSWRRIPHTMAGIIHNDKPQLFTATFCRPDLKWDSRGNLKSSFRAGQRKKVYS